MKEPTRELLNEVAPEMFRRLAQAAGVMTITGIMAFLQDIRKDHGDLECVVGAHGVADGSLLRATVSYSTTGKPDYYQKEQGLVEGQRVAEFEIS